MTRRHAFERLTLVAALLAAPVAAAAASGDVALKDSEEENARAETEGAAPTAPEETV